MSFASKYLNGNISKRVRDVTNQQDARFIDAAGKKIKGTLRVSGNDSGSIEIVDQEDNNVVINTYGSVDEIPAIVKQVNSAGTNLNAGAQIILYY